LAGIKNFSPCNVGTSVPYISFTKTNLQCDTTDYIVFSSFYFISSQICVPPPPHSDAVHLGTLYNLSQVLDL